MTNNIEALRELLFAQLRELRAASGDEGVRTAVSKAKAVSEMGAVIIDSARAEIDYLRVSKGFEAPFFEPAPDLPAGVTGITQHRIR